MKLTAAQEERARFLHFDSLTVDGHCDTITKIENQGRKLYERSAGGHLDFPRMKEGGLDVQFMAVFSDGAIRTSHFGRGMGLLNELRNQIEKSDNTILVTSAADIEKGKLEGKTMALLATEAGEIVEGNMAYLEVLYRFGVRCFGLVWNYRNQIADGVGEPEAAGGLTRFGRALVKRCNELGMLIDVSHLNVRGFWDVAELCDGPFVATHSNVWNLKNHPRNLMDDQLEHLKKVGGITGMNFCPPFIHGTPSVEDLLDHVDYIAEKFSVDIVGLGSDFDGITSTPVGLEDVTCTLNFTRGLVYRGYSDEDIRKILGGNWLRVIKEVIG